MRWVPALALAELALAAPTVVPREDVPSNGIFVISTQNGGTANEDCGDGKPITFSRDEWNKRNMNDVIVKFWNDGTGSQGTSFDFHSAWATKYGSDLYCRLADETCEGSSGVCSNLRGDSVEDKQVGLLGLRAIRNAQNIFVEMDHAISRAANNLIGTVEDFAYKILQGAKPDELFKTIFSAVIGLASTALSVTGPEGTVAAGFLTVTGGIVSDTLLKAPEDDPLKDFSEAVDAWGKATNAMHLGLNLSHSAIFSNGDYGDGQVHGPERTLPNWMWDGAMVDPASFTQSFDALEPAMTRLMAVRLIQGALMARGAFVVFLEGHQGECAKWNGCKHSPGSKYDESKCYGRDRYCHPEGIWFPLMIDENEGIHVIEGFDKIGEWANFGFDRGDLMNSVAWSYLDYGLDSATSATDFTTMINTFREGHKLEAQRGAFTLPVCKVSRDHPWQPDSMYEFNQPPCDCLGMPDKNGKFFKDYAHPNVKKWLEHKCV